MSDQNRNFLNKLIGGDISLWMMIIILSLWSLLVIFSSTGSLAYAKNDGMTTDFLIKQIVVVLVSIAVIIAVHRIPIELYFRKALPIFLIGLLLMILTFVVGTEINGEKRWLTIPGTDITFQPADFLKITLAIYISMQLSLRQKVIDKIKILPSFIDLIFGTNKNLTKRIIKQNTIPIILPIAVSCIVVTISNLSTAIIMFLTCLIILIIGRIRFIEIVKLISVTIAVFVLIVALLKIFDVGRVDTWEKRMSRFLSSEETTTETVMDRDSYQSYQARIAIASGWKMGKGIGKSSQRSNLPHPYSDYAYAFITEEYGIAGSIALVLCYLIIFYRSLYISMRAESSFMGFLVLALGLIITLQAFIHIGVSVGLAPVTGQTLPIISKGGSSMIFTCIMFGIILGASREINEAKKRIQSQQDSSDATELGAIFVDSEHEIVRKFTEEDEDSYDGIVWNYEKEDQIDS